MSSRVTAYLGLSAAAPADLTAPHVPHWVPAVLIVLLVILLVVSIVFQWLLAKRTRQLKKAITALENDIEERKRVERALRDSEERFKTLYRLSPVMMAWIGPDGRVKEVSDYWCKAFGIERGEIVGHHRLELFPPDTLRAMYEMALSTIEKLKNRNVDPNPLLDILKQLEANEGISTEELMAHPEAVFKTLTGYSMSDEGPKLVVGKEGLKVAKQAYAMLLKEIETHGEMPEVYRNFPIQFRAKNGRLMDVLMTKILHIDEQGEFHGAFVVGLDVTEQKQMEARLLHQDKISAVGMLAAGVAHEIGNPLMAISMAAQSLQRKLDDPFACRKLALITEHIDRISRIVQSMNDLARPPSHELDELDLNDVLRRSMEVVGYDKRYREIDVKLELAPSLPPVHAVEDQIAQIFINLGLNAVDAMADDNGKRPKKLAIRSEQIDQPHGPAVAVSFEDTGHGIASENLPKLFQPFFTTKDAGRGTGLGLSVSYRIAQDHNGDLTVKSRPGHGTCFTLTLPTQEPS